MKGLLLAVLLLAGCYDAPGAVAPQPEPKFGSPGAFTEGDVTLRNGQVVHCVFWTYELGAKEGFAAMDCDWAGRLR